MTQAQTVGRTLIRARIVADDSPESPREWSNIGTFVGLENRHYNIGDRRPTQAELIALEYGGWAALVKHLERQYGATRVLKVGMIDHSGVSYYIGGGPHWSDSAGWDSGTCGYIFDTAKGRAKCGTPLEFVEDVLTDEIKIYDQWARGDVYGYIIERRTLCEPCAAIDTDEDDIPDECPHCEIMDEDSCWGFYGLDIADWDVPADAIDALRDEAAAGHVEYGHGRIEAQWR